MAMMITLIIANNLLPQKQKGRQVYINNRDIPTQRTHERQIYLIAIQLVRILFEKT